MKKRNYFRERHAELNKTLRNHKDGKNCLFSEALRFFKIWSENHFATIRKSKKENYLIFFWWVRWFLWDLTPMIWDSRTLFSIFPSLKDQKKNCFFSWKNHPFFNSQIIIKNSSFLLKRTKCLYTLNSFFQNWEKQGKTGENCLRSLKSGSWKKLRNKDSTFFLN